MAADAPDPILLVHGYRGDPSTWADMIANFAAVGRTAVAIDLSSEDNVVNSRAIQAFINAKGWQRVDIVAQSMGGLSARQYIKFLKPVGRRHVRLARDAAVRDHRGVPAAVLVWRADVPIEQLPAQPQQGR